MVIESSNALFAGVAVSHSQGLVKFAYPAVSFGLGHEIRWSLRFVWLWGYLFIGADMMLLFLFLLFLGL